MEIKRSGSHSLFDLPHPTLSPRRGLSYLPVFFRLASSIAWNGFDAPFLKNFSTRFGIGRIELAIGIESSMKPLVKKLFLLPPLIAIVSLMSPVLTAAQTFTNLHDFTAQFFLGGTNGDSPEGGLVLSGNFLYGTAESGGTHGAGMVFRVNTDGTGFTNLYSFTGGADGANPQAGLILSGNTFYGTVAQSGQNNGSVFAINTDGTGFTNLFTFVGNGNGAHPETPLALSGNILYGTTSQGGSSGDGVLFRVNTNGSSFTNFYNFTGGNDGGDPAGGLILTNGTLYGTTFFGGSNGADNGTVFSISASSTNLTVLYSFTSNNDTTNSDGAESQAGLILSGTMLYGTTFAGGNFGNGTIFGVSTNGLIFTNLYSFTAGDFDDNDNLTNSDGANPIASLILSGSTLYGTAQNGGLNANGTVFAIHTDGSDFTNIYTFTAFDPDTGTNYDGAVPVANVILSGNTLYGTASGGRGLDGGTVFSLSLGSVSPPQLAINLSGTNVILTWSATGFNLQSTTNLVSPILWTPISGQNAVTNPISGTQMFYRLSQ
jgi:uncharacterized repeat protein (TIGR03803 family)